MLDTVLYISKVSHRLKLFLQFNIIHISISLLLATGLLHDFEIHIYAISIAH